MFPQINREPYSYSAVSTRKTVEINAPTVDFVQVLVIFYALFACAFLFFFFTEQFASTRVVDTEELSEPKVIQRQTVEKLCDNL